MRAGDALGQDKVAGVVDEAEAEIVDAVADREGDSMRSSGGQ